MLPEESMSVPPGLYVPFVVIVEDDAQIFCPLLFYRFQAFLILGFGEGVSARKT